MAAIAEVDYEGSNFIVRCPAWDNMRAKGIPMRQWDRATGGWMVPNMRANLVYLLKEYTPDEFTVAAQKLIDGLGSSNREIKKMPAWYVFKNEPRKHQIAPMDEGYSADHFALFMQMRTGKTFVSINIAAARAMEGKINGLVVFCPTAIKLVWKNEIKRHCPIESNVHTLVAGDKRIGKFILDNETPGLKILIVGIEALSQGNAIIQVEKFMNTHTTMAVVDESSRIKNAESMRTKKCISAGQYAKYRMILTGTPTTQGIQDLYAQFLFLDWTIIGHKSYYSFRNRYCIMGGFEGRSIVGYDNVPELMDLLKPFVHVVKFSDVTDMPKQTNEVLVTQMSKEQAKVLGDLKNNFMAEIDGKVLEINTILERMMRYMQIAGGSFPYKEDDEAEHMYLPGINPKMELLKEKAQEIVEADGKVIIWAKFRPEIALIAQHLSKEYGADSLVEYHGGITDAGREEAVDRFTNDPECRFFVSNQQTGGLGLPLHMAQYMIYYSNGFSFEEREQSEARFWAATKGDHDFRVIYDIILDHDIDWTIVKALHKKKDVADYVDAEMRGT